MKRCDMLRIVFVHIIWYTRREWAVHVEEPVLQKGTARENVALVAPALKIVPSLYRVQIDHRKHPWRCRRAWLCNKDGITCAYDKHLDVIDGAFEFAFRQG